ALTDPVTRTRLEPVVAGARSHWLDAAWHGVHHAALGDRAQAVCDAVLPALARVGYDAALLGAAEEFAVTSVACRRSHADDLLDALTDARIRTLDLLAPLGDASLTAQHSPLMSPLVWDLAHIAHYEELWLVRELGVGSATEPRFDDVYDAFKHPRAERPSLDILDPAGARAFGAAVRERVAGAETPPTGAARVDAL